MIQEMFQCDDSSCKALCLATRRTPLKLSNTTQTPLGIPPALAVHYTLHAQSISPRPTLPPSTPSPRPGKREDMKFRNMTATWDGHGMELSLTDARARGMKRNIHWIPHQPHAKRTRSKTEISKVICIAQHIIKKKQGNHEVSDGTK